MRAVRTLKKDFRTPQDAERHHQPGDSLRKGWIFGADSSSPGRLFSRSRFFFSRHWKKEFPATEIKAGRHNWQGKLETLCQSWLQDACPQFDRWGWTGKKVSTWPTALFGVLLAHTAVSFLGSFSFPSSPRTPEQKHVGSIICDNNNKARRPVLSAPPRLL